MMVPTTIAVAWLNAQIARKFGGAGHDQEGKVYTGNEYKMDVGFLCELRGLLGVLCG